LPRLGFAEGTHLLKLHREQNKVLCTIGKFSSCTPFSKLHIAFQVPYIYDYETKLCRQQAQVVQNNENAIVCDIGKSGAQHWKYNRLQLGGGQAYDRSSD
jgi:hypothetical protein